MEYFKKSICLAVNTITLGMMIWVYASFFGKVCDHYEDHPVIGIIILALFMSSLSLFFYSIGKNVENTFNKKISIIQLLGVMAIMLIMFLVVGNALTWITRITI